MPSMPNVSSFAMEPVRHARFRSLLVSLATLVLTGELQAGEQADVTSKGGAIVARLWTPRDAVEMTYLLGEGGGGATLPGTSGIQFAPDKRHLLIVTIAGDVVHNEIEVELQVFAARDIDDAIENGHELVDPILKHRYTTSNAVHSITWRPDSNGILYRRNVRSQVQPDLVSPAAISAEWNVIGLDGRLQQVAVERASKIYDLQVLGRGAYAQRRVSREEPQSALRLARMSSVGLSGLPSRSVTEYIVGYWNGTQTLELQGRVAESLPATDGRHIAIVLDRGDNCQLVVLDLLLGHANEVDFSFESGSSTRIMSVGISHGIAEVVLSRRNGTFERISVPLKSHNAFYAPDLDPVASLASAPTREARRYDEAIAERSWKVCVDHDAGTPTSVVARSLDREVLLLPKARFDDILFQKAEYLEWRSNGLACRGGLLVPLRSKASKRFPLVVQVQYEYDPMRFNAEGPSSNGYAAQSLASLGYVVLMLDMASLRDSMKTTGQIEGPLAKLIIDGAIENLERMGIVDTARIALIGHSRHGSHVYYAVSHADKYRYRAGIILDSYLGDFCTMALTGGGDWDTEAPMRYQGDFWKQTANWLEHDPTFNAHRIEAAVLFTQNGGVSFGRLAGVASLEIVLNALWQNRVPVDAALLPDALHNPGMPRERLELMCLVVDWIRYWLDGIEPVDAERSARWSTIRKRSGANLRVRAGTNRRDR